MADEKPKESKPKAVNSDDPLNDPGPPRFEDIEAAKADDTPLSAEEVPLEKSRKDETSLLSTDIITVGEDNEITVTPRK